MFKIYILNFLLALSATMSMTLIPIVATETIGLSLFLLGIIEGLTEFLSNVLRLFTGNLFDKLKHKNKLFIVPIAIAFLSKVFLFSFSYTSILLSKLLERLSNGAFAAPRDAYIGVNAINKAKSLGVSTRFRTLGCIVGPLIISLFAYHIGKINENIISLIIIATSICFIALIISFFIKNNVVEIENKKLFDKEELKSVFFLILPTLILTSLFYLSRFNDGVIILHLKNLNYPEWFYASTIGIFNFFMFLFAPFIGVKLDKFLYNFIFGLVILSMFLFNLIYLILPSNTIFLSSLGLVFWGLQRVGSQLLFTSLIFKFAPKELYGTAIGIFSVAQGFCVLLASTSTGFIINHYGFDIVYMIGMFFNVLCASYYYFKYVKFLR